MKTIGLIGGMSWESSAEYYRIINEAVKERLGGTHSAQSLMFSVDFASVEALQGSGNWEESGRQMADAALRLERGGADCIVICTNTMHISADSIQQAVSLPFIHIVDPTADAIRAMGLTRIGLLATRYTMEMDFYKGRLVDKFGLDVLIPDPDERMIIHDIIYGELILGVISDESRRAYQQVIESLVSRGAQGIILGCTEIGLLIKQEQSTVPVFDTTRLHALAAVDFALGVPQPADYVS